MNKLKKLELITELSNRAINLPVMENNTLDALLKDAEMIIKKIIEEHSDYIRTLKSIMFRPMFSPSTDSEKNETWRNGQQKLINLFNTIKKEIELFEDGKLEINEESNLSAKKLSSKIFIVHGHDNELKLDVARTIEKLKLNPVILHEQSDEGLTVIEKFEKNSLDCDFAIVLLSPDDIGCSKNTDIANAQYRARQNVVLELGYFVGAIGRKNVLALVKDDSTGSLEIPSDLAGLVYTKYDKSDGWKMSLVQRLKTSGFQVSADDLFY